MADKQTDLKAALRRYIRANGAAVLSDPNVTSIGVGRKNGTGELCLVYTVDKKVDVAMLETLDSQIIAPTIEIEGFTVPTDVIEQHFSPSMRLMPESQNVPGPRKRRVDPILPGISVSHPSGTAGTLGLIVYDTETGNPCILSNWHVLDGVQARIGDDIVQPGPHDDNDVTGNRCGTLLRSHLGAAGDCALARISGRDIDRAVFDLDVTPTRVADVDLDDRVVKSGRTTGTTYGIVTRTDVMVEINYGPGVGPKAIGGFEIGPDPDRPAFDGEISQGGDSGAAWMIAKDGAATDIFAGLHFAGETPGDPTERALACYPQSVQSKLGFALSPPNSAEMLSTRQGFDAGFLGISAPMPTLSHGLKIDAVNFEDRQTIPYTHFEVCLSAKRRLARFVAWNVDGARRVSLPRQRFRTDDRIAQDVQTDNALYRNNPLDRGHIARRADLAWGPVDEARAANRDSFFYTNIAPQHERFNQSSRAGIWGQLENQVLEQADAQDIRVSVIGGPIFHPDDPVYRDVLIPREYWKLIAYKRGDDLRAAAFVLTQAELLTDLETLDLDPFRLFQVTIGDLADRTKLDFESYNAADTLSARPEAISTNGVEITTPGDITL